MEEKTWIDYATALGSIATPLLVIVLSAIGWKFKSNVERKIALEDKLRDDRIEIYNQILEPFIILLMSDAAWSQDKKNNNRDKNEFATKKMLVVVNI
jgi:predicted nucleotide-binding protein (sugar kinase/HSP70/actin superfamily)